MSRFDDRQLERKLRPDITPEPPAWLLDELRRQIPAEIQAPAPDRLGERPGEKPGEKPGILLPFRRPLPRSVWLAAASVTMLLGGGALSYLAVRHGVGEPMPAPKSVAALHEEDQSPAEAREGSAEAMQSRDLRALGYVGAERAARPATAPTYPGRFPSAGADAARERAAAPQVPSGLAWRLQEQAAAPEPTAADDEASTPRTAVTGGVGVSGRAGIVAPPPVSQAGNETAASAPSQVETRVAEGDGDGAGAAPADPEMQGRRFRLESSSEKADAAPAGVELDEVLAAEEGEVADQFESARRQAPPAAAAPQPATGTQPVPPRAPAPQPVAPPPPATAEPAPPPVAAPQPAAPQRTAPQPAPPPSAPQRPAAEPAPALVIPPPPPAPPPPSRSVAGQAAVARERAQPPYVGSEEARVSTFALDVDRGSYNEVRRYLRQGQMPPAEAVRVEELVNAFDYGDRPPAEGPVALVVEGAPDPWAPVPGGRHVLVRFTVVAREGGLPPGARAEVEVDPRSVVRWRRLGAASSGGAGATLHAPPVRADTLAGQGAVHAVSAVYALELKPGVSEGATVAMLQLRWRPAAGGELQQVQRPLKRGELASRWEAAGRGFRLATVVGRFAELLRGAPQGERAGAELGELRKRAAAVGGDAQVKELVDWIDKARDADR